MQHHQPAVDLPQPVEIGPEQHRREQQRPQAEDNRRHILGRAAGQQHFDAEGIGGIGKTGRQGQQDAQAVDPDIAGLQEQQQAAGDGDERGQIPASARLFVADEIFEDAGKNRGRAYRHDGSDRHPGFCHRPKKTDLVEGDESAGGQGLDNRPGMSAQSAAQIGGDGQGRTSQEQAQGPDRRRRAALRRQGLRSPGGPPENGGGENKPDAPVREEAWFVIIIFHICGKPIAAGDSAMPCKTR